MTTRRQKEHEHDYVPQLIIPPCADEKGQVDPVCVICGKRKPRWGNDDLPWKHKVK